MKLLLIGAGNMGGAILSNLKDLNIDVFEKNKKRVEELKKKYPEVRFLDEMPNISNYIVILAIKPQSLNSLELQGEAEGVISILAGVSIDRLKSKIKAKGYVRAMPNVAAQIGKSITLLTGDIALREMAETILLSIGDVIWLDSEEEIDIATAIASSAPAWIAIVAEALSDGAVKMGLARNLSYKIVAKMIEGSGALLNNIHPALLKDMVTSPKGTTISGVSILEKGGVRDSFISAVEAAFKRAQELK
ncbi:MAG: pyrroline-5-carboxylate reductase [Epsilonproteobacteria bacterium]|nr:pyrroline-5-carboxylate reductase [Campylobacterota bacterium]